MLNYHILQDKVKKQNLLATIIHVVPTLTFYIKDIKTLMPLTDTQVLFKMKYALTYVVKDQLEQRDTVVAGFPACKQLACFRVVVKLFAIITS